MGGGDGRVLTAVGIAAVVCAHERGRPPDLLNARKGEETRSEITTHKHAQRIFHRSVMPRLHAADQPRLH